RIKHVVYCHLERIRRVGIGDWVIFRNSGKGSQHEVIPLGRAPCAGQHSHAGREHEQTYVAAGLASQARSLCQFFLPPAPPSPICFFWVMLRPTTSRPAAPIS
ncbi:unnamed protein product, partial [Laminaria digitata]